MARKGNSTNKDDIQDGRRQDNANTTEQEATLQGKINQRNKHVRSGQDSSNIHLMGKHNLLLEKAARAAESTIKDVGILWN